MIPETGNSQEFKHWVLDNVMVLHWPRCGCSFLPAEYHEPYRKSDLCPLHEAKELKQCVLLMCYGGGRWTPVLVEEHVHRSWLQRRLQALRIGRSAQVLLRFVLGLVPARIRARGFWPLSKLRA